MVQKWAVVVSGLLSLCAAIFWGHRRVPIDDYVEMTEDRRRFLVRASREQDEWMHR